MSKLGITDNSRHFSADGSNPQAFEAPWWLRGPHAQTIVGRWLRRGVRPFFRRVRIDTPDGDFLDLDYWSAPDIRTGEASPSRNPPFALLLHGLGGCASSGYMTLTCAALARRGIQAVALNFRSCGGEPNRSVRLYHSGETEDLGHVLGWLEREHPEVPYAVAGYSLGGNVLLKYLGERGERANRRLAAAAAVSVPLDLEACASRFEHRLGRLYSRYFLRKLGRNLRRKAVLHPGAYDLEAVRCARTLRDFDEAITAPIHGFRDANDYYRQSSSGPFLAAIRVPTLLLQAMDDPFVPREVIPLDLIANHPWLEARLSARGGHLGFIAGRIPWRARPWAEEVVADFIGRHLDAYRSDGTGAVAGQLATRRLTPRP